MDNIEKVIGAFFDSKKGIVSVHLFGSQAKGKAHAKSDVDCALLFEKGCVPDTLTLIQMREDLASSLNIDVDLVCLNTASPIIGLQIYKHGKILIQRNEKQYFQYIMDLFTDYFDLKLLRKPMEEAILKRKYYG